MIDILRLCTIVYFNVTLIFDCCDWLVTYVSLPRLTLSYNEPYDFKTNNIINIRTLYQHKIH